MEEIQKKLTNYSISLHMIAKSFKSIEKYDEAKEFLNRALHVAENLLPTKNPKIVETMKIDLNDITRSTRVLPKSRVKEDPDALLEKLAKLMISRKKKTGEKGEETKQHPSRSYSRTPTTKKLGHSSSSERYDEAMSAKPPLASATKRSYVSKKSSASKSIKVQRAEDDTEFMDLSIYDDKNFDQKQDDYVKERIQQQAENLPKLPTISKSVSSPEKVAENPKTGKVDRSKIKRPKFNLAKEGAIRDRDEKPEDSKHPPEEDEKMDDRSRRLHSIIKYNESQGVHVSDDEEEQKDNLLKEFYPTNINDNASEMGTSVQSQAVTHNERKPKKPEKAGAKPVKKKDPVTRASRPKLHTKPAAKKKPAKAQEIEDDDYADDKHIPDESEITKKLDHSFSRFRNRKKADKLIDDYIESDDEVAKAQEYSPPKPLTETDGNNELITRLLSSGQKKQPQEEQEQEDSKSGSKQRKQDPIKTLGRRPNKITRPPESTTSEGRPTPRYLREYRKKKEQGK